ncbi:plectin [Novymonas esmeraldas]|uniref:Plectin n=1 Tax=Novymonas esmeraldas TaxID=1808958 RepID=A0AAW0F3C2_9TRYP
MLQNGATASGAAAPPQQPHPQPQQRPTAPPGHVPLTHVSRSGSSAGLPAIESGAVGVGHPPVFIPRLTPEREAALQAKGRELLEERRRDIAEHGPRYTAEEAAVMEERGRELLRAAREAAAANGGHHVPVTMLSAAARMAATSAGHLAALRSRSSEVTPLSDGPPPRTVAAVGVASPGTGKPASAGAVAAAPPTSPPSSPAQDLLAEVQRLQRVVAEQQEQLLRAQQAELQQTQRQPPLPPPPTPPPQSPQPDRLAGEPTITQAEADAMKASLIQQFNEHMAQCEGANQEYWATVTRQHQDALATVQRECEGLRRRAAESDAAAAAAQAQLAAEALAHADVAATLRADVDHALEQLRAAQTECAATAAAKLAAEEEVRTLHRSLETQLATLARFEESLAHTEAQLQAARREAETAVRAATEDTDTVRSQLSTLQAEIDRLQLELEGAHNRLAHTHEPTAAAPPNGGSNPFADAEDPFGGPSSAAAHAADDGALDAARARIAELEAALAAAGDEVLAARESAAAAVAAAAAAPRGGSNPFADAEDPFGGPSSAAAHAADDGALDAARARIAELEAALAAAGDEVLAARESAAAAAAAAAAAPRGDSNPFADAEDPFGGPSSAAAHAADDGALDAARARIAELEAALAAAGDEVLAARESAAAAVAAAAAAPRGGSNPFADAEDPFGGPSSAAAHAADDGALDAARARIAELEAALAAAGDEVLAARESAAAAVAATTSSGGAASTTEGELEAARQYVADLEDALAEAAGELDRLQDDVEEKTKLIQALRAGEAALGSLRMEMTSSGSGSSTWGVVHSGEHAHGEGEDLGVAVAVAEATRVLRTRVSDLTHEVDRLRRQQERPVALGMVPGMEALGRQFAEVEHRLSLAEEAKAALKAEVRRLRRVAREAPGGWYSESESIGDEERGEAAAAAATAVRTGVSGEPSVPPPEDATRTTAMATASDSVMQPYHSASLGSDVDGVAVAEGGMMLAAVPPPPPAPQPSQAMDVPEGGARLPTHTSTSDVLAATERASGAVLRAAQLGTADTTACPANETSEDGDEDGHHTPHTLASFHMGACPPPTQVEEEEAGGPTYGRRRSGSTTASGGGGGGDAAAVCHQAESCHTQVPTTSEEGRVSGDALSTGREEDVDTHNPRGSSRDVDVDGEDDEVNTEEYDVSVSTRVAASRGGHRPAPASPAATPTNKVDDSGPAMQELGRRYADAQHRLYRSEEARQGLEAELVELRTTVAGLQTLLAGQTAQLATAAAASAAAPAEDARDDARTRSATASSDSSVPTTARERRPLQSGSERQSSSSPTPSLSRYGDGDRASTALEQRVAELEAQLEKMTTQHDEELRALAEAAADRIAVLDQQYADDMAAVEAGAAERSAEWEARVGQLSDALAAAKQAHQSQADDLASAEAQVDQLEAALADAQAAHAAQLQQRLGEQEDSFEAAIRRLDQQHQEQLRVLASAGEVGSGSVEGDAVAAATAEARHWAEQHATLVKRFDQLQREYDAFAEDTAALQRRLHEQEAAQQEQEHSKSMRDAAAQQLVSLHQRLEEMSKVVDAAQADAQTRSEEVRAATARHTEAEAALRAEVTGLRSQLLSTRDELARANSLNEELSELLQHGATSVETALRDRDAQHSTLEQQAQQLQRQLASAGERLTERQAALAEERAKSDALQQRVMELEGERRAAEAQLRGARRTAEDKERSAAHVAERAARDAEQAREVAQQAMAHQHAIHEEETAALHRELDEVRKELEAAATVAATVPLEAQRHQRDLSTVRERLAEALRSQQDLQQQLKSSRAEVERQRQLLVRGGRGGEVGEAAAAGTGEADGDDDGAAAAADARLAALLRRSEELEESLREAVAERDGLQAEKDRLSIQVKSAARVADVKEQGTRRQEAELRSTRAQLATVRDDLAQRVQSNHALQLEMDHAQERLAEGGRAYEEVQRLYMEALARSATQEHAEALLMAKAITIPRAWEEYGEAVLSAYHAMLQAASKDRRYIRERCDLIERAAGEAMAEAEEQSRAYEAALADAHEEQQQMKELMDGLQQAAQRAEEAQAAAMAEAAAAREELELSQRHAREEVFAAQRDLQAAELQHADTLHSLSLLQDEVTNTAALIKHQKGSYERREAELAEEVALLQAELDARKSAARQLQQTTEEGRTELQDLVDGAVLARDQAVREAQALQAQLARALPRLAQLEDEQAQRTADLMDTAQQLSALHKTTSSTQEVSRKHIEELNRTLQELLHAHATLQRTHTSTEATAERLKTQAANAEQELQRTAAKASQQEEELTMVRARLHEVETRTTRVMADDQARLRDGERRLHGLEQRNGALHQECKALQESLQSLRIEHESTADALTRRSEASAAQELQLNHQLRLLRERVESLEVERQGLLSSEQAVTAERDAGQRRVLALEQQVEHLQHHLQDANGHNERLNQEMVQLKTDHVAEVERLRDAITEAQKELAKCRQLLAQAEALQVEQDGKLYSLGSELGSAREELRSARAQAERSTQQYRKAKTEQEEMATLLQSQMAQLYEDLRVVQEQLRALENTSANQQNTIDGLRQDATEAEEHLRHTRQELRNQQEAAAAAKEHHRRDRYELQAKLNDAEDAVAEGTRGYEQYRQRMTSRVELYEVAEQALRAEVTDLRADVARLEAALAATSQGKVAAETHQSRQAHSIRAVESEVQSLRAQAAHDMSEITTLKVHLQQRTAELERCRREAAAQLAGERLRWGAEHTAACDALGEALRQAQQATADAREARERALAALERKQRDVVAAEEECRATRALARRLQRHLDAAQYQLTSLEGMAKDTAEALGMVAADLRSGGGGAVEEGEDGALVSVSAAAHAHPHDTSLESADSGATAAVDAAAASGAAVQSVMDELQRRLGIFTFAANTLDAEDDQLAALRRAMGQQEDALRLLVDVCAGDAVAATAGVTPLRAGRAGAGVATPGLNSTPTPRGGARVSADISGVSGIGGAALRAAATPAQRVYVQHIHQSGSTYLHRVEDHLRTAQHMLRTVMTAIATHEMTPPLVSRPTTAALSARHKLQVAATVAELHRRTAALTRAVERVLDIIAVAAPGGGGGGGGLQVSLQELRRIFADAERYALLPFNELLCVPAESLAPSEEDGGRGGVCGSPTQPPSASSSSPSPSSSMTRPATAAAPVPVVSSSSRVSVTTRARDMAVVAPVSPVAQHERAGQWF